MHAVWKLFLFAWLSNIVALFVAAWVVSGVEYGDDFWVLFIAALVFTTVNWFDGSSDVVWTQGRSAVFVGAPGTATLALPISAQNLTFGTDGHSITGSTLSRAATATLR